VYKDLVLHILHTEISCDIQWNPQFTETISALLV